jgi:gliding motility-associated-like protein
MSKIVKQTLFLFACMLIGMNPVDAQNKQNNQWRYGNGGGVDFNTNPPTFVSGAALVTSEGSASVADPITGALLFYTDGVTVWNALNQVMLNGTNLQGGSPILLSSTTAATIVRRPSSCNLYYIVTADEGSSGNTSTGINYSLVDMTLDGGLGGIVPAQKNIPLVATTSEKLEIVPAANGNDFWFITHENNTFYSVLLTSGGFQNPQIVSTAGGGLASTAGHLKVNNANNMLACGSFFESNMKLFSFDNATGIVSDLTEWKLDPIMLSYSPSVYGVEFSPSGQYLYISNINSIVQYNISIIDSAIIRNSAYTVQTGGFYASLQLGPDSNIYVNGGSIEAILNPNLGGAACNYQLNYITNQTSGGGYGLPKKVYANAGAYTGSISINTCGNYTAPWGTVYTQSGNYSQTLVSADGCDSIINLDLTIAALVAPIANLQACSSYTAPWGTVYTQSGTYIDTLFTASGCDSIIEVNLTITGLPTLSVSAVSGTCGQPNGTATATATGGSGNYAYTWSNGATGSFISGLSSGSYSVIATDQNGCSSTSQVVVSTSPASGVTLTSSDTILGLNETATLQILGGATYNWTPSAGLSCDDCFSVIASPIVSTTYTVTGTDSVGCPYLRVVNVVVDIICGELFVPDIFSPNGIGNSENEKLCVYSNCIKSMNLGIYNRWGELIFSTDNQNDCWDGTHKGVPVMTGVYSYRLFVEQFDGEKIEKSGVITLTR